MAYKPCTPKRPINVTIDNRAANIIKVFMSAKSSITSLLGKNGLHKWYTKEASDWLVFLVMEKLRLEFYLGPWTMWDSTLNATLSNSIFPSPNVRFNKWEYHKK